jgi:hypothetical protein
MHAMHGLAVCGVPIAVGGARLPSNGVKIAIVSAATPLLLKCSSEAAARLSNLMQVVILYCITANRTPREALKLSVT